MSVITCFWIILAVIATLSLVMSNSVAMEREYHKANEKTSGFLGSYFPRYLFPFIFPFSHKSCKEILVRFFPYNSVFPLPWG